MFNLELWKKRKNELQWTYDEIAKNAKVSKRTVADIFRGFTTDPRIDTVQSIEKALGLPSSEWTDEERAEGVTDSVKAVITADEAELLDLYREIGKTLGKSKQAFVMAFMELILQVKP